MDILAQIDDLENSDSELEEFVLEENGDDFDLETEGFDDALDYEMSPGKARELTDAIKAAVTATWVLIQRAHEGKAYKALGYSTWAEYVKVEFDMTASRSYQLLDFGKFVNEIEAVTPDGTEVKITEAQARDLKRELPFITERIKEETQGLDSDEASETVDRIVDEMREDKRAEEKAVAQREKELEDAELEGYQKGIEAVATQMLEADAAGSMTDNADSEFVEVEVQGDGLESLSPQQKVDVFNFLNVLSGLTSLPEPDDFLAIAPKSIAADINNQLNIGTAWLNRFSTLWEMENEG